ncbi:MAG TPA: hypothetical protein DCM87_10400 [Planctomycetes bacterium]|nr:hypothetical protein [Planctomycetota bacterium]
MRRAMMQKTVECLADAAPAASPLDGAFAALAAYEWGTDANAVRPIEDAIAAAFGNPQLRAELETRLGAVVKSGAPPAGLLLACKHLSRVGGAGCVPALAAVLAGGGEAAPAARYALERITAPEAGQALRAELARTPPAGRIGIINSLGVRREPESVPALAACLGGDAPEVAAAAAAALGDIGGEEAAKALGAARAKAAGDLRLAIADALLACAERLLAEGKPADARALYESLDSAGQPAHVAEAVRRGITRARGAK